jgi:hypothetical protein
VRRLQRPAIAQLNLADNQVNVSAPLEKSAQPVGEASARPTLPDHGPATIHDMLNEQAVLVREKARLVDPRRPKA